MSGTLQIAAPLWTGHSFEPYAILEVREGRIHDIMPYQKHRLRPDARVFDHGALMLPGFHDAHLHLLEGGLQMGEADFDGVSEKAVFAEKLSQYFNSQELEPGQWIQGHGLDETVIEITGCDIEAVCSKNPVFIWNHDLHSAVVNSAALEKVGITQDTRDPPGGRFERNERNGLTGVLREQAAYLVYKAIPPVSEERALQALNRAQRLAFSKGITAASASVSGDLLRYYLNFAETPECEIRLNLWKVTPDFNIDTDRFDRRESLTCRLMTFKGFTDGALGSATAAFHEPYRAGGRGMAHIDSHKLSHFIREAHAQGYQTAFHAIGDRANTICLDAFEEAAVRDDFGFRPRIEHAQHLRMDDVYRFAELGVIASMQPVHCTADMRFVEERLGKEREGLSYAWRSLLDTGVPMAFGSDWPIENPDPIAGIHAAVTRQDSRGNPAGGWQPQQRITVREAITAYTAAPAYAAHWDGELGTLRRGKLADITILSQSILDALPSKILETKVLLTVAGGKIVYERETQQAN